LLSRRMKLARTLEERLFAWMILGDERAVSETYVMGALAEARHPAR
jgi:guanine deaminase